MGKIIFTLLAVLALAGCSLMPDYRRPSLETPESWRTGTAVGAKEINSDWWTNFGDEELDLLMKQALAENNDLQAGIHRIEQSRAALTFTGASLLPSADASGSASRSRTNPASGKTIYESRWRAGVGVSYELDLFGANRSNIKAAEADLWSAELSQDALALVTMGDVAGQYFFILNLRDRLAIADRNLDIAREVLRIVQARYDAGTENALAIAQQKSSLASAEAARISLAEQLTNAENAFAVLLGKPPGQIDVQTDSLQSLTIPRISPGQPSSLLERRPDIRAVEAGLIAANADIGVARAAFFPSINLGLDWSISAAGFGEPTGTAVSLASALAAPLFQGGRLKAGVEQATARQAELAERYQQAVLVAFQETEDALAAVTSSQEREKTLATAMEEAQNSYDLTKQLYDAGRVDFQTLLDVQRTLLNAEDSFAQAKFARLSASTALYLAVGGGWRGPPEEL
jgi:NodT family efflux transporter outer membrane factor (OMF) lipoprotein